MLRDRLRRARRWLSSTPDSLASADLIGWAEGLYSGSTADAPLRGAVFAIEQLEMHAKALAATHTVGHRRGGARLLRRLADSERVIERCHRLMQAAQTDERHLTPAAEWLLDNHYLIEEQVYLTRKHFPPGYSRQLPPLATGKLGGLPRVYDLILEFIAHVDGRVDDDALARYIGAYQSVTHLTLGELWSVAIMLRLALIENLRRVAASIAWQRAHRECALRWAQRLDVPTSDKHASAVLVLAEMVRERPPLSTAFVAQFTQALHGHGATATFVLAWLDQRLAEQGQTIDDVVRAESQSQAADQASMANSIASLRLVNATPWHKFVEANSATESILRAEPAGVYARMDFSTRDEYRHAVEAMARRLHQDEELVAHTAVRLGLAKEGEAATHVGYVLVDEGKPLLERALRRQETTRWRPRKLSRPLTLFAYLAPPTLLCATGAAWLLLQAGLAPDVTWALMAVCATLVSSQVAMTTVNWLASMLRAPRALPRMDFEHGIPDDCRTMVVVPTLLFGAARVAAMIEGLELRHLANRDANLWFALLTDFNDASTEHAADDKRLLALAVTGIEELNNKYGASGHGRFFLFHRPRLYNPGERCFMGRERKRGKIEDFNALICGDDRGAFSRIVGDVSQITSIRYVITLDTDTDLPWGAGWRLVGAAAHPLNRPVFDASGHRLARGYAILQPRVSISVRSAGKSHYAQLLAGDVGLDPYTRVVSDLYQDLFAEASFVGKGLYDVGVFRHLLDGRFPDNAVLSHDLLESCYARSAQCNDVELIEDSPSSYLADVSRRHRWMRGDWQIAPWLGQHARDAAGRRAYPTLAALSWWKIFDNLRRALVAPSYVMLLLLGWVIAPSPLGWTLAVLSLLFAPDLLPGLAELWQRPAKLPLSRHVQSVLAATTRRLLRTSLWLTFLPFEATVALDAAVLSLWRVVYSRRHLLQWHSAAAAEGVAALTVCGTARRMWVGPVIATATGVGLAATGAQATAIFVSPVLLLWFASPLVAWWISRALPTGQTVLVEHEKRFLRRIARLTWRYFEVFAGPQENWLPPDNFQEVPSHRVAHRTSPTNMGLALLSNLTAYDLGYLSVGQLLDRTTHAIESMEQLERHLGHFFNWYDTNSRKPLRPLYISTVDSGNLIGHLRVLHSGLLELPKSGLLPAEALPGLGDTWRILCEQVVETPKVSTVDRLLLRETDSLSTRVAWLMELDAAATQMCESIDRQEQPEAAWWANAFERQVRSLLDDLTQMAPWLVIDTSALTDETRRLIAIVGQAASLGELGARAQQAALALAAESTHDGHDQVSEAFRLGAQRVASRLRQSAALAQRCLGLADAELAFLYDQRRKLLHIGYWVSERRLDSGFYDLLASEARLASYVGIAASEIPFEHWFALGRRLATVSSRQVLLSWSGSMFEYLMPLLVMPGFKGTLLDETCHAAVARQIEYGRQQDLPWGISESCYNQTDADGTYQYHAFGAPGLGLSRGLSDDLVVSPYASILALLVDPERACANLRRLATEACVGAYGFYEAIDFTPSRLSPGQHAVVVQAFMAHHHGMSLLALMHTLLGPRMQQRFLANADLRAAALLLQERVPKAKALRPPFTREAQVSRFGPNRLAQPVMRVLTNPNTPVPEVHLLSNGRYHVMVSAAGGGYSRWHDLALTRWREDPMAESFGVFCFVSDVATHRVWSSAFQPTLRAGRHYEAVFTPGRAEFRRQDDQVETHTEIAVATEDDLEVRRITLTNRGKTPRLLLCTGYTEVVLASGVTDELHRVFSNLFVHTEHVPEHNAVLLTRRPRSTDEQSPWMFCMMLAANASVGACSYDTDRARCLGRGRSVHEPAMLDDFGGLSGSAGAVLDPCVAMRREVELVADGSVRLDLIIGAAPTREAAMTLVSKYQDHRMADRVFEVAPTHSRALLGQLGASEIEAQHYEQLAAAVIFPVGAYRAQGSVMRRNRKGQSGLWAYAISGDLPIVLLRVRDDSNLRLVRDVLNAHAYWRLRGLFCDLVIWNEEASGYRCLLNDKILELIAAGALAQSVDKPGGVFVRHVDIFPEDDRVLLQAVARIVIRDVDGPLDKQLLRWQQALLPTRVSMRALAPKPQSAKSVVTSTSPRDDLLFANGQGGFTQDGREYIIDLPPGSHTPAPWVNVIANPRLGTVVSESGSAYTWYGNAQLCRLTPWHNDTVTDASGEVLYIRDDESGRFSSPMPWPRHSTSAYSCRHGFGYSVFEHREDDLSSTLTTYVAVEAPLKFLALKIKNYSPRARALSVFAAFELVLGDLKSRQGMHVVTELEPLTGAIFARNSYSVEFSKCVAFVDCSEPVRDVSGDRAEVLGRNGDVASPAALRLRKLSGRLGAGLDACAAMQVRIELGAEEEREVVFIFGAANSTAEAIALVESHRGVGAAGVALREVWKFWNEKLGVLYAETPDAALNLLVNGWLPYQVLSCRMWGRSGFYQSGGAYGFRDQLQDCVALLHEIPELCRQHLLLCATRQFTTGDVQHWWHPQTGRGVRTACSDDYLWLPYAVCRYVSFTGDTGVLDEQVPYLVGRARAAHEESYYDLPGRSEQTGTLYEHCARAILYGLKQGAHGLPLMGSGDWNDGMNRVGHLGQGESVWLGFFLHHVVSQFALVATQHGDEALAKRCHETATTLSEHLEQHAWDGEWYRRAYFDNGEVLGSVKNNECQIDSLPQAWATIAGVGDRERRDVALDSMWERLVCSRLQLAKLFAPPFDHSPVDPGYIKGYPPGVRENGGQYTHGAVWAAWALALAGRNQQATALISMLNPINHALDPLAVERYKVEPYVLAADIYSERPHEGRGGWTWYTGSAAWLYRLLHEVVFGIERHVDTLRFQPRPPASWGTFKVHYRYYQTFYHLVFTQAATAMTQIQLTLDGQLLPDAALKLVNDQREHTVEVLFAPSSVT